MRKTILSVWTFATLSAQANFYPTFKTQEIVNRYFNEDPVAAKGKKKGFSIQVDNEVGKIVFLWTDSGKKIRRTKYLQNRVRGRMECQVTGDSFPLIFRYLFSFDSEIEENFISWRIASLCRDSKRFSTPGGKAIRKYVDGFDLAVLPRFVINQFQGYSAFVSGDVAREEKKPFANPLFTLEYHSYCLPRVVPSCIRGSRPGPYIDSPFSHESDPEFVTGWWDFLWRNKLSGFQDEYRLTLGPGLDAEKATLREMINELIYNVQAAKTDNWVPWAEGGEPLMASLNEIESLIMNPGNKELSRKLDEAMQRLEPLKGKGRSEFYSMVRTYLVFLKKKTLE